MFCCIIPPIQEGETAVVFNKELQSKLDQKFLERVDQRKIRYIRYYNNEEHVNYMTWQAIFNTTSRKVCKSWYLVIHKSLRKHLFADILI